jgi:hypothetical protein
MTASSLGFTGLTATTLLDNRATLAAEPAVFDRVKAVIVRVVRGLYDRLHGPTVPEARIEPTVAAESPSEAAAMALVAERVEAEIAQGVNALVETQKTADQTSAPPTPAVAAAPVPAPDKVQEMLARFEVVPPAREAAAPQAATPGSGGTGVVIDATTKFASEPAAALPDVETVAAGRAAGGSAAVGFGAGNLDVNSLRAGAEAAIERPAADRQRGRSEEDQDEEEALGAPEARLNGPVTVNPPGAAAILAQGVVAGMGFGKNVVTAPFRSLSRAMSGLSGARRTEAQKALGSVLKGTTLQSLTEHNVAGMEEDITDLGHAVTKLHQDPKISRVLSEIRDVAAEAHKDEMSIVKEMRPGGKYEHLQKEWDAAITDSAAFADFETVGRDLVRRLYRDVPKIANTGEPLLTRYQKAIEQGAALAHGVPARKGPDGKMLDTLHAKFVSFTDLLKRAIEKVRDVLMGKSARNDDPSPGQ